MLKSLSFLSRFYFFWLVFFFIDRLIFILYFPGKLKGTPFLQILKTFPSGVRMDMSFAGYVSAVPLLVFIVCWIFRVRLSPRIPKTYTKVIITLFSIITIVNFNIYREWGTKINYRALDFAINSPGEAFASSSSSPVFSSLLILAVLVIISFHLQKRIIDYRMPAAIQWYKQLLISLLFIFLTFTAIRGGWQLSPINESMAYFSERPFLNHAAVNTEWTLVHSILDNKYGKKNPYPYFKHMDEAKALVDQLHALPSDSSQKVLATTNPNVVVIILESYTADLVKSLGGEEATSPNFENLIRNGLLFSNIYATGDRTDKGLIGILSGFPSQATRSILKINNKHEKLPSLAEIFKEKQYSTSFYYGGESEFFNLKSYILSHSYERLIDKHDFQKRDMNSKWGAYDDVVFQRQLADLKKEKQPFFTTLLTLTNHEPFELPVTPHFPGEAVGDKFRSTAYYTDSCLNAFLNEAKKYDWYKNTLFVIVADHGHRLPRNKYENYDPNRFKIPFLLYGDVIKNEFRGKKIEKVGSQIDLAATILNQLNLNSSRFKWSKDLLNPSVRQFAFFTWDNGFGFATSAQIISFDNVSKQVIYNEPLPSEGGQLSSNLSKGEQPSDEETKKLVEYGKAYMQVVFQEYMDY